MISFLQYIEEIWRTPKDRYAKGKYTGKPRDKKKKVPAAEKKKKKKSDDDVFDLAAWDPQRPTGGRRK